MDAFVPEWTKQHAPEDEEEISDEESEEEHFECVACHKTFKSEKQFEAHEKSKKHQKAVYALKRQMQKDNARLNLGENAPSSGVETPLSKDDDIYEDYVDGEGDKESASASASDIEPGKDGEVDKPAVGRHEDTEEEEEDNDDDSDYAPRSNVESRLDGTPAQSSTEDSAQASLSTTLVNDEDDDENNPPGPTQKKLGKAAQKRAKKAAKAAEVDTDELKFKCATCNAGFPSKTQLFQHIKDFKGHAAPVPAAKGKAGKKR
jgi:DnaJ family protein A protein 5